MKIKIIFFFLLTILIPTALLAYFGLLAVRSEKQIVERNMRQKYVAIADIVEEEIKNSLSQAPEHLLTNEEYWESMLLKGAGIFKDEVFLFDREGNPLGQAAGRSMEDAAFVRAAQNLPYIVAVYEPHTILTQVLETKEKHLTSYVSIIIFASFSILAGSIFTLSALAREWRQAKLKSEFASHLSHDLRRPLTSIRMFSEMLQNDDVPSEAKKKEYYKIISEESDKLTHLAHNILDFSRIEEGRRKYHIQDEDITRIVKEAVDRFRMYTLHETRKVQLNIDPVPSGHAVSGKEKQNRYPVVKVDAGAITQALMNLLTNADKYSPADKDIIVNVKNGKRHVTVEVVDQGHGIPREAQKKVFQKFYRANRDDVSEVEGSGLGLALVQYTAQAHGGRITVTSELGKGSTFALVLPV